MNILQVHDGPSTLSLISFLAGMRLVKEAGAPTPSYNMVGTLYASPSGWILLSVPAALVRGVFAAMREPGIELPPSRHRETLEPHISVMSADDVKLVGGVDRITERGKQFHYSLGQLMSVEPDSWPGVSKVWFLSAYSPELQALRRSYGLSSLPHKGEYGFHVTCALRKRGTLEPNEKSKAAADAATASGDVNQQAARASARLPAVAVAASA